MLFTVLLWCICHCNPIILNLILKVWRLLEHVFSSYYCMYNRVISSFGFCHWPVNISGNFFWGSGLVPSTPCFGEVVFVELYWYSVAEKFANFSAELQPNHRGSIVGYSVWIVIWFSAQTFVDDASSVSCVGINFDRTSQSN